MNKALSRLNVSAGRSPRVHHDPIVWRRLDLDYGHNQEIYWMRRFINQVTRECERYYSICFNDEEEDFLNYVNRSSSHIVDGLLITTASDISQDVSSVVGHELYHAVYFSDEKYRIAIVEFWQHYVEDSVKAQIEEILFRTYLRQQNVLLNEFQAYILMPGGQNAQGTFKSSWSGGNNFRPYFYSFR